LRSVIQRELERSSNGLPVARIRSMDDVTMQSTARTQWIMSLMSVFAGSAVLLAVIGVYGLTAYSVRQRTYDIGVRLALGATASHVKRMLVIEGMQRALVGILIGVACAFGVARVLSAVLFGVTPRDPAVFLAAPIALAFVALAAVWVPALRVSSIDPVNALRHD
jgi:ABC-type antimicrobial peptide transport system permease subunit